MATSHRSHGAYSYVGVPLLLHIQSHGDVGLDVEKEGDADKAVSFKRSFYRQDVSPQ